MKGIVINIDPVILRFGSFELGWHAIATVLAIIAALSIAAYEAKRKGVPPNEIYSLCPWVVVAGIVGARLFHVLDHWSYYAANPSQIWAIQGGGLAIWGALVGGGVAVIGYARAKRLSLSLLADTLVPALLTAQIIGRVGCTINGDAYGGATNLPWGFTYINPGASIPGDLLGVPTHPYPVYEMIWNGLVLLFILRLRHQLKLDGLLFVSYLSLYSLGRLVLSFVRQENVWFWGLQEAQVIAIAILMLSVAALIYLLRRERASTARGESS